MPNNAQNFFSIAEEQKIISTIKSAEKNTSGEIRVHLDNSLELNEWQRTQKIFFDLRMNETALRNGVLFHISVKNKKFSIIADEGINRCVPDNFWKDIVEEMQKSFQNNYFCDGLCKAIEETGKALKKYFPYQTNDTNEQSDEISKA